MINEIAFAHISYSFLYDLADSMLTVPKFPKIQIDHGPGIDYYTSACFKAEIDDAGAFVGEEAFHICAFPHESILPSKKFAVFVIAVEGQDLTIVKKITGISTVKREPIYHYHNDRKISVPWNIVFLLEIENMNSPVFFKRYIEVDPKKQKGTVFEIMTPKGVLN